MIALMCGVLSAAQEQEEGVSASDGSADETEAHVGTAANSDDSTVTIPASQTPSASLTAIEEPDIGAVGGGRTFFNPGLRLQTTMENESGNLGDVKSRLRAVTHAFGTLAAQRVWRRYDLSLAYLGEGVYWTGNSRHNGQAHGLTTDQKVSWARGQLRLLDAFSYSPEAVFGGGAFGGASFESLLPQILPGQLNNQLFGPVQFSGFGFANRISNTALAEVQERLTMRSSVTAVLSYGLLHFLDQGNISSNQYNFQFGYNYVLSSRSSLGISAGGGLFRFKGLGHSFDTETVMLIYGRQITGPLSLNLGAGPQLTRMQSLPGMKPSWTSLAGLQYRRPRLEVGLRYQRFINNGSGITNGAQTDFVRATLNRPLGKRWAGSLNGGYARSKALESAFTGHQSFGSFYSGLQITRQLSPTTGFFLTYQFDNRRSSNSICVLGQCGQRMQRHQLGIGFNWTPHPRQID